MRKNINKALSTPQASQLTRSAFLWTRILGTPFWGLISMLPFILYKDLHITPLQITMLIALKPMSSLLAPYWSQAIYQRPDQLISNLVWANILRYIPFLLLPFFDSIWLIILAFGIYMMLHRATVPAWMEIVKHHLPGTARERAVGHASTIEYIGTAVITLLFGFTLDHYEHIWRWLLPGMALLGLASTWFLGKIPVPECSPKLPSPTRVPFNIQENIVKPWKHSLKLMRERPDFARFQLGFMLGGAGLMITQPALPTFFVDALHLSYLEMCLALTICKGIGVAVAAPLWTRLFSKIDIFHFSGLVTLLAALFPLLLLMAPMHLSVLYFAYILYGVMQAGSEMSWHMSGLTFSEDKESSAFSSTNVLMVGLRGCFIPALGAALLSMSYSVTVMLCGVVLSLIASGQLIRYSRLLAAKATPAAQQ